MINRLIALGLTLSIHGWAPSAGQAAKYKVLDFWGVGGYAHDSRPVANTYFDSLAKSMDFELTKTEDANVFTTANLAQYKVVILNNCTQMGKILDTNQRGALMAFMKVKGVLSIHASGDQKGTWPEYTAFMGGELGTHGAGIATVRPDPAGAGHPVGAGLDTGRFDEEWYSYKTNPRLTPNITVLYTVDESSCKNCTGPTMITDGKVDHPIVWIRTEPTGGRFFYSGMGHMSWIFKDVKLTRTLFKQAMDWAAGTTTPEAALAPISRKSGDMEVRMQGLVLEVAIGSAGNHSLSLRTLDGRQVTGRSGQGPVSYFFPGLRASEVYTLTATTAQGSSSRLVP
jgi:type 1 glutamine amidotransferase